MRVQSHTRSMLVATAFGLVVLSIVGIAAIFSVTRDTETVGDYGTTGILAEATLSAAAATQNATSQVQVVAATSASTETAIARAEEALEEFGRRTNQLATELSDTATQQQLRRDSDTFAVSAVLAVGQIRMGNIDGAGQTIAGDLTSAYEAVASTLITIRNDASATISTAQGNAARMADAARFFVVLLVPVMILVAYRYHLRRVRRQEELERELDRERIAGRTKSDFIAEISHQLRTPLAGIYGSALELRNPAIGANAELSELATLITRQSAALTKLVENTLTLATADQGQLTVDVREMNPVTEIVGVLESLAVVGHTTSRELTPGVVIADPHYFRQIVSNLASNAHRYGHEPVEVRSGISGDNYVIEITDSGEGIDGDDEQRHLNRHVAAAVSPLATEITDLDLSATEILVAQMGGALEFGRRDGKAVFTVWLPRA